jgi:predicted  nucleic acid-binding Zn-ribbon protein
VRSGELGAGAEAELTALREEVGDLRRELGELHERIDFTERLLAQAREKDRLPGREQS